jgi:D-alanyl-D-alanine carboxypeptidase
MPALIGLFLFGHSIPADAEKNTLPNINGEFGVSIDVFNGKVLYGKNENTQAFPASITKVLTAILADEHLTDTDLITISELAYMQEPSNDQLLLKKDEVISKEDALEMLLLISSNDVAYAIAEEIGGSIEGFSAMMNKKAIELGAKNTNFTTPNGLPNSEHKTTAYDMALFGREMTKHPYLMNIISKKTADISLPGRTASIHIKHKIFDTNTKALGGKTGWTQASGNTLLVISKDGDKEIVSVVMKSNSAGASYSDINTMNNYSFPLFKSKLFYSKGDIVSSFDIKSKQINLIAKDSITISYKDEKKINNKVIWAKKKNFSKDEVAAWLVILDNNKEVERFPLSISKTVKVSDDVKSDILKPISEEIKKVNYIKALIIFSLIIFLPSFLFFLLFRISHKKR